MAGSLSDLLLLTECGFSGGLLNGEACVRGLQWKSGVDVNTLLKVPWCGTSCGCSYENHRHELIKEPKMLPTVLAPDLFIPLWDPGVTMCTK